MQFSRPKKHHCSSQHYVSHFLAAAKYIFIRTNAQRGPLQRPYIGPYAVIVPGDKTFLVHISGRWQISVDLLKPAFVDASIPIPLDKLQRRGMSPNSNHQNGNPNHYNHSKVGVQPTQDISFNSHDVTTKMTSRQSLCIR